MEHFPMSEKSKQMENGVAVVCLLVRFELKQKANQSEMTWNIY